MPKIITNETREIIYGYSTYGADGSPMSVGDGSFQIHGQYEVGELVKAVREAIVESINNPNITSKNIILTFMFENIVYKEVDNG